MSLIAFLTDNAKIEFLFKLPVWQYANIHFEGTMESGLYNYLKLTRIVKAISLLCNGCMNYHYICADQRLLTP